MNCPFCAEDIRDAATVCRYCRRDLALIKPLIDANKTLTAKVAALEGEIAALNSRASLAMPEAVDVARSPTASLPTEPLGFKGYALGFVALPIVLLLAVHYLMIMKFDLNPLYLRAASILIPLPFGYLLLRRTYPHYMPTILIGCMVGLIAVSGMNAVVGLIDRVSIIPENFQEWRESVEYILSIALAFLLGGLISQSFNSIKFQGDRDGDPVAVTGMLGNMSKWLAVNVRMTDSKKTLTERIQSAEKLMNSGMAVATAAGAVFAGIRAFF